MKTVEEIARDTAGDGAEALLDRQFRAPGIQALPELLQPFVFDHYLLAGRHAIIALQRVLNEKGEECPRSGAICPVTLRAARRAVESLGVLLLYACARDRRDRAYDFAYVAKERRCFVAGPNGTKGIRIMEAETFLPAEKHLSLEDHRKRLSLWV
ncbi:MAG: hypothetical protein RSE12_12140 [Fuscovulum sp.]|nr:MAG: hypothetical protein RSE12_12140 [Fuscovulum sp.]